LQKIKKMNQSKHIVKLVPPALKQGDTIGIIAPAGPITEAQANIAIQKIRQAGYIAKSAEGLCNTYGYLAGSDESRANQINSMFADKNVKAIICARGGYGTSRILDMIDYDLIASNPKIIGGYSDITALLTAIYKKTGLITFHSSMLVPDDNAYTRNSMWNIFSNGTRGHIIACNNNEQDEAPTITISPKSNKSKCQGTLVGGNLCLLDSLLGTKYDISLHNKILFIEEINEPPYKIDRMLTHLRMSKNLNGLAGLIIGKLKGCEAQGNHSLPLNDVINDFCKDLNIPIVANFSFGHVKSRCTLPIGARVELDCYKKEIKLLEDVVVPQSNISSIS